MKLIVSSSVSLALVFVATPGMAQAQGWTGPYVGVYGEAAQSKTDYEDMGCWYVCTKPTTQGVKAAGGGTLGYDAQIDENFVVGIAGDLGSGFRQRTVIGGPDAPANASVTLDSKVSLQYAIRARAGLIVGDTMVYGTAGAAFAKARMAAESRDFALMQAFAEVTANYTATWTGTTSGMVLGAGIEHRMDKLSLRLEAVRAQYGRHTACNVNVAGPDAGQCWDNVGYIPSQVAHDLSVTSVRVGLNYRF